MNVSISIMCLLVFVVLLLILTVFFENIYYSLAETKLNINITKLLFDKYYPIVKVDYESDTMVVLEGNKQYLSVINGSLVPFWETIDKVKNQGYLLKEITTSRTGSKENPTIFYAVLVNQSKLENLK